MARSAARLRSGKADAFMPADGFLDADGESATTAAAEQRLVTSPCRQYVLHRVCRLDTLAGVAIKYGVEVADVKRLNGLSIDLQMFAHKTLRIPLIARHNSSSSPPHPPRFHNTRHKVSPAMSLLHAEEVVAYGNGMPACFNDQPWIMEHRKTRTLMSSSSLANGYAVEGNGDNDNDTLIRRHREEGGGGFSVRAGEGLALRPKSCNRPDINKSQQDVKSLGRPAYGDGLHAVRKSSRTRDLQKSDISSTCSIWPESFTLTLPIFDSLPKPIFAWRNKKARD